MSGAQNSEKDQQSGDFLYVEEVNSNEGLSRRLTGIDTSKSVQDLKKAIATELGNPEEWNGITVAFADRELGDLTATLESFTVQEGDTLFFSRSVSPAIAPPTYSSTSQEEIILKNVMFQDVDGKTLTLHDIPISWKVSQLRQKLGVEKKIEAEYYRFLWGGKQLEDHLTLKQYGLGKDCTIHMVMRLKGGSCN